MHILFWLSQTWSVVWIFLRSLDVIFYDRWVLSDGHEKLLQGLVSHDLTTYLYIFNLFKLNELWPYYQKYVNQTILNRITLYLMLNFTNIRIFEAFVWILLIVNQSLNQTLLTFLLSPFLDVTRMSISTDLSSHSQALEYLLT